MKLLVHIVTGPENPSKVALALLVANAAVDEGHDVRVFLAGDGVQLARPATAAATTGVGLGNVAEHFEKLRAADVPFFLSRMSSEARELDPPEGFEAVAPPRLVENVGWADKILIY
jgi:predicted peroxiredoxin